MTRSADTLGTLALFCLSFAACSNKLDMKECDRMRGEAFEILNKGQQCNDDKDCRQSEWPGCAKPVSNASWDKIKPLSESYKKGQCEEPKIECPKDPPEAYCKQGLCVHREKGAREGASDTPADQIIVK